MRKRDGHNADEYHHAENDRPNPHIDPLPDVRLGNVHFYYTGLSCTIQVGEEGSSMERIPTTRIDMRFPTDLLRRVEEYQRRAGLLTRTSAIVQLVRIGLEQEMKKGGHPKNGDE